MRKRGLDRLLPVWLFIGLALGVCYSVMPTAWSASFLSVAAGLTALVATVIGVRRYRPENAGAWWIFASGIGVWVAGDGILAALQLTGSTDLPVEAAVLYLCAYPLLAVAIYRLTRVRRPRNWSNLTDVAIVASGLCLIYWIVVIGPIAADASQPLILRLINVGLPTMSIVLLAAVIPLLFRGGRRSASIWLLSAGSAVSMVGNLLYTLTPTLFDSLPVLVSAGFVFTYICWAGAALHPSMAASHSQTGPEQFGKTRFGALAASTLLVPGVLFAEGMRRPAHIEWVAIGIGAVVLFLLVLLRMSGFVGQVQRQAQQLEDLAMRDDLTGLANRRLFEDRLTVLGGAGSPQVAILDLNGFKDVNDRFGHAVGDRLLVVLAERLKATLRPDSLVARMGGDEFAVLLEDAPPSAMAGVVERLMAALRRPIRAYDHELLVGVSIGYADGTGIDSSWEVLRRADIAMYEAKAQGGGRICRYRPELDREASERAQLGAELRTALDLGQFRLVYQPIVALPEGRVTSVEALVRWDHPERGFVGPVEFIPVAEENGLIVDLGAWVLSTACRQAVRWRNEHGPAAPERMSVNVSARQLAEPGFAGFVSSVLAETGLAAHQLIVEVTETAVFGGGQAVQAVTDLHNLGIRIALDDFGTGHSSLGLLQTVPVDVLKVDKSFVDTITMAGRHAVIATALIQVANGLGLTAVAEGVETAEQAAELHRLGYRLAQGYHFGKPVPEPDFRKAAEVAV